jgi:hypothetical protein
MVGFRLRDWAHSTLDWPVLLVLASSAKILIFDRPTYYTLPVKIFSIDASGLKYEALMVGII